MLLAPFVDSTSLRFWSICRPNMQMRGLVAFFAWIPVPRTVILECYLITVFSEM